MASSAIFCRFAFARSFRWHGRAIRDLAGARLEMPHKPKADKKVGGSTPPIQRWWFLSSNFEFQTLGRGARTFI